MSSATQTMTDHPFGKLMAKRATIFLLISSCVILATGFSLQADFAQNLQRKLVLYYQRHVPVNIHMTFNQPVFAPGDTARYRILCFRSGSLLRTKGRQVAEVSLVDETGTIVQRSKVLLVDGAGTNQIVFDKGLDPGRYTVVASTAPMEDYDHSLFFRCPVWVSGQKSKVENENRRIEFFPEGGNLVAGVTNKVVVRGPRNLNGRVIDATGTEVASFRIDEAGFGLFFIVPSADETYSADASEIKNIPLPAVQPDGISLLVSVPRNTLPIRVTVQVPDDSQYRHAKTYLTMTSHERLLYTAELVLSDKNFQTFALPQDKLPPGLARISILRENGNALAERLLFVNSVEPGRLRIELPRDTFTVREVIPITISATDSLGQGMASDIAVSVYHSDFLVDRDTSRKTLIENVRLFGHLSGSLMNWAPPIGDASLDNFLITQKWKSYSWDDVYEEKSAARGVRRYLHLSGIVSRAGGEPLPDSTLITFFLQRNVITYELFVSPSGEFDFPVLIDFYGQEEIYYHVESRGKLLPDARVRLADDPIVPEGSVVTRSVERDDPYHVFSTTRQRIQRSYAYHINDHEYDTPVSLNALIEEEIFGPDKTVRFDEYLMFPTMSEALREIVPMLQHRNQKGRDLIRLFFDDRNRFADGQPLFIIDGIITDNTTYFLSLQPSDVLSIKIVNSFEKLQVFGAVGRNGIVLVETKIPENHLQVPRSESTFHAEGLQPLLPHNNKDLSVRDRLPDLRTNIYWSPSAQTDSTGNLQIMVLASDVTGNFKIRVEGFTQTGAPISVEKALYVSFVDE